MRTARRLPLALALLVLPLPAPAQSFAEAVWTNLSIAAQLCIQPQDSGPAWAGFFRNAGFAETVERSTVNSDTTHFFTAPADTVVVELYYGETPDYCAATTRHLDVTAASQMLDAIAPKIYPGYVRKVDQGPINPATGQPSLCVSYEDPTSEIGHVIGASPVLSAQDPPGCSDNGSSRIYSSYRV